MSVRLAFEIGHEATKKSKPSKEGFTHDWELFLRGETREGVNGDIAHFVEKVVFMLHDSFPKPKRVIKEPPYVVKESGYAGFMVKIEIYLKNRDDPKKVVYEYDLDLQPKKVNLKELFIASPSDEFRRKCLKGGGQLMPSDFKSRDSHHKPAASSSSSEIRKPLKRPDELLVKPNDKFAETFGQPLSRGHQNPSPIPSKGLSSSSKSASTTSSKEKPAEKPAKQHKHSPSKDGSKDQNKKSSQDVDKAKKDKGKDRERSEKKDKTSKRPSSPSPSSSMSSSSARNNTAQHATSSSKSDPKPKSKSNSSSATTGAISTSDPAFIKKSSKKEKKSEKDRERSDKKDQRKFESPPKAKDRDSLSAVKEEKKTKSSPGEPKNHTSADDKRQQHDKDAERKHKHKKKDKDKSKDKEAERDVKKEKSSKNNPSSYQSKSKEVIKSATPLSEIESDVESPPSIKQESENSNSEPIPQKPPVVENKKSDKRSKNDSKEEKSRKRKAVKEQRDSSSSPPCKNSKLDSSDKSNADSNSLNNNIDEGKMSNEYISELKDLKQKINGLKNNDEIQHVVKIIASTGCYEITKSSFDFDLVQLDRSTVQSLLEMFKFKK